MIFLKRWLAYLLLPGGLVLLFVPLCTHRMGDIEKNFLFLENSENLIASDMPTETGTPSAKPDSLQEAVQQMHDRRKQKALEDARANEIINPYGYPRVTIEELDRYPAIADRVKTMQRIWSAVPRLNRQDTVSLAEWDAFQEAVGISVNENAFQYGRYIFKGYVKPGSVSVPVEIKHLKIGCRVAGGLFLIFLVFGRFTEPILFRPAAFVSVAATLSSSGMLLLLFSGEYSPGGFWNLSWQVSFKPQRNGARTLP